ncbi:hypothetical protein [Rubellimicrobium roseum]|uniref:Glycosyltransferase family 2 protein n=1 Tax=Rubellimicrobium roseum TaxID=687525 RepID=A0A5C4NJV1_9RHOB|nr:hypothetical protein [Rubellimicrobium roseum]TNC74175.1 hypothetical protein FHG71_02995 [Rubellimicrobium roseum]
MDDITHCLTIGSRPDLLAASLDSLSPELRAVRTLAVNDFGDAESSAVLLDRCPNGRIVGTGAPRQGQHRVIDAMYAEVTTPFIWHDEDDWAYTRHDFLDPARHLLEVEPSLSAVCFRGISDFTWFTEADRARIRHEERDGVRYACLDRLHDQWHGWTFNPHLARRALWEELGGFARFEKERHVSRHLRAQGKVVAFLEPGFCHHIGDQRTTMPRPPKRFARLRDWWRGRSPG